jgi:hypothetical protein
LYWLACRDWLFLAGMITLLIGVIAFLLGTFSFTRYVFAEQRFAQATRTSLRWHRVLFALLLLLANIPAAWIGLGCAFHLGNIRYVDVINESGTTIDNCTIDVDVVSETFSSGSIAPGQKFRITTPPNFTGKPLNLEIQQGAYRVTQSVPWSANWTRIRVKPGLFTDIEHID